MRFGEVAGLVLAMVLCAGCGSDKGGSGGAGMGGAGGAGGAGAGGAGTGGAGAGGSGGSGGAAAGGDCGDCEKYKACCALPAVMANTSFTAACSVAADNLMKCQMTTGPGRIGINTGCGTYLSLVGRAFPNEPACH